MAAALKCPNPSCPFLFDPTQVPPGAVLTCPRCQMRFTLGQPGQPAAGPDPGLDFSKKPAPTSTAKTDSPAEPEIESAKPSFFQSRGMIVVGIAACAAVVFALAFLLVSGGGNSGGTAPGEKPFRDINFAITIPDDWTTDAELKVNAKANVLAMQKAESSARVMVASSNYQTRVPPSGDLRDGIVTDRLDALFEDADVTPEDGTWLGLKAQKYKFRARGKSSAGIFVGEAYAVIHNSYAYWFLAWSQEADYSKVATELETIRTSARLINPNAEWKASDTTSATIAEEKYTLIDGDKWWQKQTDPTLEDAKADLVLIARFKSKVKNDNPPKATAVVYMLDGGDDALGKLRTFVKDRYAKLYGIKKWNDVTDAVQGDAPAAGEVVVGDVARYHAESTEDARISKLVVLFAVTLPDGKIAGIEVSCPWSDRTRWEKRFTQLAGSLKAK